MTKFRKTSPCNVAFAAEKSGTNLSGIAPAKPGGWDGEEAVVRGRCRITGEQMRRVAALIS
jgi:hypothetical protein